MSAASDGQLEGADAPSADADDQPFVIHHPLLGDITDRPAGLPDCVPWPFPPHWRRNSTALDKLMAATPFERPPHGLLHPDLFHVPSGTVLRGMFINKSKTTRVPDIEPDL